MADNAEALEEVLDGLLEPSDGLGHKVMDAMRYSTLGGGKRIRPFLVVSSAELFSVDRRSALRAAAGGERGVGLGFCTMEQVPGNPKQNVL